MKVRSAVGGACVLVLLLTAGAAQSLSGSNTVASDDIINGQVYGADIHDRAVTSAKIGNGEVKRPDMGFDPLSDVVTVFEDATIPANTLQGIVRVECPGDKPVVLGGGFETTSNTFIVKASAPEPEFGDGWIVVGRTSATESAYVLAHARCAFAGRVAPR